MSNILDKARTFILTNARLLERRIYEVLFEGASPECVVQSVCAYQNPDGGLGHALEPDVRCSESQPLFASFGLVALKEAGCRDTGFAASLCDYLSSVSDDKGLVPLIGQTAYRSPMAEHWMNMSVSFAADLGINPTAGICALLHYQGVKHEWLSLATETCYCKLVASPSLDAHALACAAQLAEFIPDSSKAANLMDMITKTLPRARFYIPEAPVKEYGLTPLHFAPKLDSICRELFTQSQIDGHLQDLTEKQLPDGGWPISWNAPGPASEMEWRGRITLDAISRLSAYKLI